MDAGLVDKQQSAESSTNDTTLSAQQFYQHDPLLVLLKDKLRLNDLWIITGAIVRGELIYSCGLGGPAGCDSGPLVIR
jgi:hypothetical protein